jgi:hypothetical protein
MMTVNWTNRCFELIRAPLGLGLKGGVLLVAVHQTKATDQSLVKAKHCWKVVQDESPRRAAAREEAKALDYYEDTEGLCTVQSVLSCWRLVQQETNIVWLHCMDHSCRPQEC